MAGCESLGFAYCRPDVRNPPTKAGSRGALPLVGSGPEREGRRTAVTGKQTGVSLEPSYHLERYRRNRRDALATLGGKCVKCGTTDDLEIDHIDRSTKSFDIALLLSGYSRKRVALELAKCQVLCKTHHREKTAAERPGPRHGTEHMYLRYRCRCDLCRAEKSRMKKVRAARAKGM